MEDSLIREEKMELQEKEEEEENVMEEKSEEENPFDFDLSPENLELAQKILSIELIWIKILENLDTKSLVDFRLVNKTWEKEATSIILKGSKTRLRFNFDSQSEVIKIKIKNGNRNLSDLNECIRKSGRFPCSYFNLYLVPLDDADLTEFFTLHRWQVKRLDFNLCEQDPAQLRDILLQVPMLEELRFLDCYWDESSPSLFRWFPKNSVQIFPHLKFLSYQIFPWASDIIRVSPKLEKVHICNDSLNGIEALASTRKIHSVKKISIKKDNQNILVLESLADGSPKIEQLCLDLQFELENPELANPLTMNRRFVNALSKILDSSTETLTRVNLEVAEGPCSWLGVKWPRLENVQDLTLSCNDRNSNSNIIPPNFISQVFPNIRKLETYEASSSLLFSCKVPLAHLEECTMFQLFTNQYLDNVSSFAPNLRKLELTSVPNFQEIASSLWACSRLTEVDMTLNVTTDLTSFPQLDMAFTGLSEEMVRKLHGDLDYFNEMKISRNKEEISRSNLSILNCPDLTVLKLVIFGEICGPPLLTFVSGEFGFKMLENLHVDISAQPDIFPSLDSLKPYASLSPW